MHIAETRLLRTLALIMKDINRQVIIMIATFKHTIREIDVLAIHKEILIQQAHLVKGLAAQHTVGTTHHLNLARLVPRQIPHVIPSKQAMLRPAVAESQHLEERHHRRRQSPSALHGTLSCSIEHSHPHSTRIFMDIHEIYTFLQHVFAYNGIRVEQQHILTPALSDSNIVGTGKS